MSTNALSNITQTSSNTNTNGLSAHHLLFVSSIDLQLRHRNAVENSDILSGFQKKGNLFLQNICYSENDVAHLELGQEIMRTEQAATFVSVRYARSHKLPLKKAFLSILYPFPQFAHPRFEKSFI